GELKHEHVLASTALPGLFRAINVASPAEAAGWYVDGGTRLNTPLKPALKLGCERVVVIGLNTTRARILDADPARRPDLFEGVGQLTQAVLADPLAHDVRTLANLNNLAENGARDLSLVPYILIEPKVRDRIGEIARDVFSAPYTSGKRRLPSIGTVGRLLMADTPPASGELFSYLFFAPEFTEALIAEGAADARAWLAATHTHGIW